MRRNLLHVSVALLTFTIGFLTTGTQEGLVKASLIALSAFTLLKIIISSSPDLHYLKVAVLTLLIWIPFAAVTLQVAFPYRSCEIYPSEENESVSEGQEKLTPREPNSEPLSNPCGCSQSFTEAKPDQEEQWQKASINGGVLNRRAISLPKPPYPPIAIAARVSGTVVVQILIDERGCIESARALSGHPLLQAVSVQAARQSCFYPTLLAGQPVKIKGVITYYHHP